MIFFGGPYYNLQALTALVALADALGVDHDHVVSTGDVVAYCADGQRCVDLIRKNAIQVVAGNCEKQLSIGSDECGCGFEEGSTCSVLADGWYPHAMASVDAPSRNWMGTLPDVLTFDHQGKKFAVVHGGASDISRFLWSTSEEVSFASEIELLEQLTGPVDGVISGHSGIAFSRRVGKHEWINAGALGMPQNDGDPRTSFVVLESGRFRFERLEYDAQAASTAMIEAGLTQGYEKTLLTGYWPSEDVLPKALRRGAKVA